MAKHLRGECAIYRANIKPCPDCLSAFGQEVPQEKPVDVVRKAKAKAKAEAVAVPPGEHPYLRTPPVDAGVPESLKFGDPILRVKILEDISDERVRQMAIGFGVQHTPLEWLRILTEELGEIAQAMDGEGEARVEEEAIQLAAGCVAMIESIRIQRGKKA